MAAPLLGTDLQTLRRERTSVKWRAYGADLLPLWVAEMDATPCPPVVDAVTAALARGDTGYGTGGTYAEALDRYAADHWAWRVGTSRATAVADVMIGVEEVLRELTGPGDTVVLSSPVYDAFYGFLEMMHRRVVEAPLTEEGRLDPAAIGAALADARAGGRRAAYLLCNPHNRPAPCTPGPSWRRSPGSVGRPGHPSSPTRSTHPWCSTAASCRG